MASIVHVAGENGDVVAARGSNTWTRQTALQKRWETSAAMAES
eukprot:CAMPEP_0174829050 /NCGR_PEP_ID=MMETSP1114-20130205/1690_1 /TAXON_ID=312471 /ORGANISM="Neobodo designis, Strain CCAP 1951/1" /LENGTH=42 /DNA_ID= /DNA_START= /DNA_END= /DNA_ORIENTATION=